MGRYRRAITVALVEAVSATGYKLANTIDSAVDELRLRSGYYYRRPECVCPHGDECWEGAWTRYWSKDERTAS